MGVVTESDSETDANKRSNSVPLNEVKSKTKKKVDLDEIRYIDEAEENNNKMDRTQETMLDNQMVLEPKFVDYGSIHPTTDGGHQQHGGAHGGGLLTPLPPAAAVAAADEDDEDRRPPPGVKMTQGDLYQRQPLLGASADRWGHHVGAGGAARTYYDADDDDEDGVAAGGAAGVGVGGGGAAPALGAGGEKAPPPNGAIAIDMPAPARGDEPRFPRERCKTLLAAVIMCFNFIFTLTSLSLVHERVPERDRVGPLPDVFLDNVPAVDWALDVSEYIIMVCMNTCIIAMVFHKHRFIVFRRLFLIMSLLYMYRAVTMYVTVLPLASRTYPCSPKSNETSPLMIMKRVLHLMSGFGLSVNGKHVYCGDFIYSGHTVILVLSYLIMSEYTPKKFYPIHWIYWVLAVIGVIMLQLSHGHYTVDVIIAYFITTRIFWTYHTLANNASLKQYSSNNLLSRSWWFSLFLYFEGNVGGPLPKQFDWPLPWPRRWHSKSRAS